jgi:hypothetical protein
MVPKAGFARKCDAAFVIGQTYQLEAVEARSAVSHSHEFAWLRDAWANLPEDIADMYPTPEALRKRALIQAGYYDETIIDAGSNAAALRVASYIRSRSDFSLVIVRGPLVFERQAKSQSRRAMDKQTFQDSKTKIMEVVSEMVGVTPAQLMREAGKAA